MLAIITILASMLLPGFSRTRESGRRSVCQSNLKQIGLAAQMYLQDNDNGFLPAFGKLTESIDSPANCAKSRVVDAWWGEILLPYVRSVGIFKCPSARNQIAVGGVETLWNNTCATPTPAPTTPPSPTPVPTSGGPTTPSCPAVAAHVPNPAYYSYAFNSISENAVYWTHTPSLPGVKYGFSFSDTSVNCPVRRYPRPISMTLVPHPEETIWLADGEQDNGYLPAPEFFADDHLDYAATTVHRLVKRHHDGFDALFADGHVKWLRTARPSLWTVQDD